MVEYQNIYFKEYIGLYGEAIGSCVGRDVFAEMRRDIDEDVTHTLYRINFHNIVIADPNFLRESIINIAALYRGRRHFSICGMPLVGDLATNLQLVCVDSNVPFVAWKDHQYKVFGIVDSTLLRTVLGRRSITTCEAAKVLNITVQNAGTSLKKLVDTGYIWRYPRATATGGIEHVYCAIQ